MTREEAIGALDALRDHLLPEADFAELAAAIRDGWPEDFRAIFSARQDLTAGPCALNARDYHLGELADAVEAGRRRSPSSALQARIRYHAQWLLFLGSPGAATRPKVSLVIPTYNRAWAIDSLVANCRRQTYANIELVFINDGSTDGSLEKLRALGDRIRLVDQENKGVSGARNAGIAAATGELIHFLDSDNLLHPDHVAEKVQAFATIPDAEHCYCRAAEVAIFGATPEVRMTNSFASEERDISPTDDLLSYSVLRGFPFLMTASTLPRHLLLGVAPAFDEDLPRREDARLWFRLAVGGMKTIRLGRPLFYRIRMKDGLNEARRADKISGAIVMMRNLVDLLRHPDHWPQAIQFLTNRNNARRFEESDGVTSAAYEVDFQRLLQAVGDLPAAEARPAISALPMLIVLAGFARHQLGRAKSNTGRWRNLSVAVADAIGKTQDWQSLNADFWKNQRLDRRFLKWLDKFLSASPAGLSKQKAAELDLARAVLKQAAVSTSAVQPHPRGLATFVVPVCDRPEKAAETIRSVLDQSMSRTASIIVVDADRSRLAEWRRVSPRITALHAETFAEAHALGLDARETLFLRFLRPGDKLEPQALGKQLLRAVLHPTKVLVEADDLPAAGTFDALASTQAFPPLSAMWFPKWILSKIGGFDVVLGNALEKRYGLRLRAGRVPFKRVPVLTERSDFAPNIDGREMALDAVSSLILAFRGQQIWKCIPGLFQDLAASGFAGESKPGMLLHRAFEVLQQEASSLARGADGGTSLPALALCLAGLARYGASLPPDLVALKAAIESNLRYVGGETRPPGFYAGIFDGTRSEALLDAVKSAIGAKPVQPLEQELRSLQNALERAE